MNYEKFFNHLMLKIRENTTYIDNQQRTRYQQDKLHRDEIEFITVLHSQNHQSDNYWPDFDEAEGILIFSKMDEDNAYNKPTKVNTSAKRNNFIAHEFKFKKIQTWIKKWTECAFIENAWLSKHASQHLIGVWMLERTAR